MNIYIVRHGQTDSNIIKNRFGGRVDVLLNDAGRDEAREVKRNLELINFDRVYYSPLKISYITRFPKHKVLDQFTDFENLHYNHFYEELFLDLAQIDLYIHI